ncbi:MAG TPA: hypothetical protein PKC98_19425 [Candidatus Melainabacteria bacterium]|nr:hypothetical protein [Candidatus Melainabacteria bacterium]
MEGKYTRTLIKAKQPVTCCFVCSSTTLDFSNSSLTDEELREIVSVCPNLTKLDLYGTNISNAGLAHISGLTSLTTLYLPENIDDAGLAHISGLTSLANHALPALREHRRCRAGAPLRIDQSDHA